MFPFSNYSPPVSHRPHGGEVEKFVLTRCGSRQGATVGFTPGGGGGWRVVGGTQGGDVDYADADSDDDDDTDDESLLEDELTPL